MSGIVKTLRDRDQWMQSVLAHEKLTAGAKAVAIRLGLHFNVDTGQCNPAIPTIADGCAMKERAAYRGLSGLQKHGYIRRSGKKGGPSNNYTLIDPGTLDEETGFNPVRGDRVVNVNPVRGDRETLSGETGKPCPGRHPNRERTEKENREERLSPKISLTVDKKPAPAKKTKPDTTAEFESWWRIYPKRVAKDAARRVYSKIITTGRATAAELLQGAFRYKAERAGQDPRFTKHPATWLNGGCWQDEAAPAAGGVTIDEQGNVIDQPRPAARAGPKTHLDRALAIIQGGKE